MTNEEALKILDTGLYEIARKYGKTEIPEIIQICKSALLQQIPRKPVQIKRKGISIWTAEGITVTVNCCPCCKSEVDDDYCSNCGQALDWSEK